LLAQEVDYLADVGQGEAAVDVGVVEEGCGVDFGFLVVIVVGGGGGGAGAGEGELEEAVVATEG
jgi:hypothetical protein